MGDSVFITDIDYIKDRIDDQQSYYSKKAKTNKSWYYFFKTVTIAIAVTIPYLTGILNDHPELKYLIGFLSLLLAFCNGIDSLRKYQEKWISYRTTSEELKQEKFLYQAKAGPYANSTSWSLLTERVENVLSKQNGSWSQFMKDTKPNNTSN